MTKGVKTLDSAAVLIAALAVLGVVVMTQLAPEQWLYDTFVDRNEMMGDTR